MDLATLIGLVSGTTVVLVAIFMGGHFMTFVNVPSLLIVVGGAMAATVLRFTLADVLTSFRTGISTALSQTRVTPQMVIDEMVDLARQARKNGLIGLDGIDVDNEFLKHHAPARGAPGAGAGGCAAGGARCGCCRARGTHARSGRGALSNPGRDRRHGAACRRHGRCAAHRRPGRRRCRDG